MEMTVAAPPLDTAGAALLSDIAQLTTLVNGAVNSARWPSMVAQLHALQRQAIDHFMATYWVAADQILETMVPTGQDAHTSKDLLTIASLQAQSDAYVQTQVANYPQYSISYPNNQYATQLYAVQMRLVDYYMDKGLIFPGLILSTMTGVQSRPFNYISDYTFYQSWVDGGA
jgi:hypothetical protein